MIPPSLAIARFAKVDVGAPAGLLVHVAVLVIDGVRTSANPARHVEVHGHGEKH